MLAVLIALFLMVILVYVVAIYYMRRKERAFVSSQAEMIRRTMLLEETQCQLEEKHRQSQSLLQKLRHSEMQENANDVIAWVRLAADGKRRMDEADWKRLFSAVDEFKEVSERYTFMKTQYEDLVESEKTLQKVIEELDEGMRKQFKEKFEEIRVEFDRVFKELFGGGKGTLELVEDEDVIEAGIRIISQPPGKKLQNMMQLSGGEKALTAIALMFAIQNLKPSPFCLLDEIEAALDDSNVGRFANYLHKLTANTQFIVITHRRGTMTSADRLYGITMQEKGVSTLVSVNLIEKDLDK